jgi:hypothetical protein
VLEGFVLGERGHLGLAHTCVTPTRRYATDIARDNARASKCACKEEKRDLLRKSEQRRKIPSFLKCFSSLVFQKTFRRVHSISASSPDFESSVNFRNAFSEIVIIYFQVFTFNARYSSMTCVTLTLTSPVDFRGESTNETNNLSRKVTSREGTSSERAALHRDVAREVARWQHAAGARARAHRRGYRLGVA